MASRGASVFRSVRQHTTSKPTTLSCQRPFSTPTSAPAASYHSTRQHRTPSTHHRTPSSTHTSKPYSTRTPPPKPGPPASRDRGPPSSETTQTDFAALDVLGGTPAPATSVDICAYDGFQLDNGLRVLEGDGVLLASGEAFVWRPWMARGEGGEVVTGRMLREKGMGTGGVVEGGLMSVERAAWGVLEVVWPKPELLILGTGRTIRPLSPATRAALQELGVRIEVLDTRNAASHFNLLATERGIGEVAAALLPLGFGEK